MVQLAPALDEIDAGFDLRSFDCLAQVEPHHFWFVARNTLITWLVRKFAGGAKHVLEIGCGTGFVLRALRAALPGARFAGSELHSAGLNHARRRHGASVEWIQMDARHVGLQSAVDLVGAFDILEHIPEDEAVLTQIRNALRPGGVLIATVPQHRWLWSGSDERAHHERRYRVGELARKAQNAGLVPIYQSSFVSLAFPLMLAARLAPRKPLANWQEELERDLQVSPFANGFLSQICRLEHRLRRWGIRFPFGGSQVLVAQRPSSIPPTH